MNITAPKSSNKPRKSTFQTIITNLTFWVLIAIIAGILLGHFSPENGVKMEILGKRFIDIIKLFIGPIIFLTIVLGISGMGNLKKVGRIGIKALGYFEVVSTVALAIGVSVAYFFKPGKIDRSGLTLGDASQYTKGTAEHFSWLQFFFSNFTLQVLLAAIICGIALNFYKKREQTILVLERASKVVFTGLKYVMYLA
ncbi:MAG: cation:dicarboxylase symporter family transporter, partial [Flavobacterium sp.]